MYTTCTWWYSPGTTIIKVDVYVHVPDGILRVLLLLRWMYNYMYLMVFSGTTIIKVDVYYMYLMVFSGTTIIKVDVYVHVSDGILRYYYY